MNCSYTSPILFCTIVYKYYRNPRTHIRPDYDMFWDFISLRPETMHTTLMMFADRGIPKSYRQMHGYSVNTFAFVNSHGEFFYCKFHYLTNQGKFQILQNLFNEFIEKLNRVFLHAVCSNGWNLYKPIYSRVKSIQVNLLEAGLSHLKQLPKTHTSSGNVKASKSTSLPKSTSCEIQWLSFKWHSHLSHLPDLAAPIIGYSQDLKECFK